MAKNEAKPLAEVVIFRGTYVTPDGSFGPGSTVSVEPEEADRLRRLGIVKPDDYVAPAEVQDGTLKIVAKDGPNVTTTVA
jgi:hypothetical protein